jgi:DNA polymerase III delta prime subunit
VNPFFHPSTKNSIDNFIANPSHALLLAGPQGSGKGTTAQFIASTILGIPFKNINSSQHVLTIQKTEKSVTIESVRSIQNFLQLKTPGNQAIRRVILVEDGETMSIEAQNAFLKILEEPPADTLIIITTSTVEKLLPTIQSRSQQMRILPLSLAQLTSYYKELFSESEIKKAYFISEGYAGLFTAIVKQDASHPLVEQIIIAKNILSENTFERLIQVDTIVKQKNIPLFLQAMERVCHASLARAVETNNPAAARWTSRLKAIISAETFLKNNPSQKLLLTDLLLNL